MESKFSYLSTRMRRFFHLCINRLFLKPWVFISGLIFNLIFKNTFFKYVLLLNFKWDFVYKKSYLIFLHSEGNQKKKILSNKFYSVTLCSPGHHQTPTDTPQQNSPTQAGPPFIAVTQCVLSSPIYSNPVITRLFPRANDSIGCKRWAKFYISSLPVHKINVHSSSLFFLVFSKWIIVVFFLFN